MYQLFPTWLLSVASTLVATQYYTSFATAASIEKENEVKEIMQKMEADVVSLRNEIERVYSKRCETKTLVDCGENNFNDCSSTFPGQVCMEANELVVTACGDGISCNGKKVLFYVYWDFYFDAYEIHIYLPWQVYGISNFQLSAYHQP